MVTGDGYGESGEVFVFLSFFKFLLLVDGYGRWLREMVMESLCFAFSRFFSLWAMVTGCLCFPLREAAPGKKSAVGSKQVFLQCLSLKTAYRQEWEMVTGKGYGTFWFSLFLSVSSFGGWLREMVTGSLWEMVTGSLRFPFFLIFLFLGNGYGKWLREVFVFLFFLDISPFRGMVTGDGYGRWLRG